MEGAVARAIFTKKKKKKKLIMQLVRGLSCCDAVRIFPMFSCSAGKASDTSKHV